MIWTRSGRPGQLKLRRDGWTVKQLPVSKLWVVTFRGVQADRTFTAGVTAREWVDGNPDAQQFASKVLRKELDR